MKSFGILAAIAAGSLFAHDLYLMPAKFTVKPGDRLTVAIHNGDAFPESENSPVLNRLRDVKLGNAPVRGLRDLQNKATGEVTVGGKGTFILTTRTIPSFIELKPAEFENYLIEESLDHVRQYRQEHNESSKPGRERYAKFAKAIVTSGTPDDGYKKPAGFAIEFIPEQNPATLKTGDELTVQVLHDGKPSFNLSVEASNESETKIVGRLDSSGRIRIPITRAGRWRLHTVAMRRAAQPKANGDASEDALKQAADWESFWASLTFEIHP